MNEIAIAVESLTKRYGDVTAVEAIDFTVPAGSTCALLGGNGAGKTTTLSMLLGLLLPTHGSISILGEDLVRHRYRVLHRMNFSSPYVDLPHRLNVRQNLTIYAHLYEVNKPGKRISELADQLELNALLKRPYGTLSAGQRTRVGLAKALLNRPQVLLLDEPTASLDPDTADRIRGYLQDYRDQTGATLMLASHNMVEVERLCDQVLMLRDGRIVNHGTPAALIAAYGRQTMEQVFLDVARQTVAPSSAGISHDL